MIHTRFFCLKQLYREMLNYILKIIYFIDIQNDAVVLLLAPDVVRQLLEVNVGGDSVIVH